MCNTNLLAQHMWSKIVIENLYRLLRVSPSFVPIPHHDNNTFPYIPKCWQGGGPIGFYSQSSI